MKRLLGPALILLCTIIWGTAFLAQKTGSAHYGPFTLTCFRNILAGLFLGSVVLVRGGRLTRIELAGGAVSGVALFAAMAAQQLGIEHTTPGVSAFLTANYILFVPVFAWAVGKGRPGAAVWSAVALALAGAFLISAAAASDLFGLGRGELLTLLCAVLYAVQIMVVDRFAPRCDVLRFSVVQTFAAAMCAAPFVFLPSEADRLTLAHFTAGWWSLFYLGVMSSGIAYTLQNFGQALTAAPVAALIMSFESVVGAASGWIAFGDALSARQLVGCALVFAAILLAQFAPSTLQGEQQ